MNGGLTPATPQRRYGPRLDSLNASQIDAIRRIPPHDKAETDAIYARCPASIFLDEAYFQTEQARIFRQKAVVLAPSAARGLLDQT